MANFDLQLVIDFLTELANSTQFDAEQIDEGIDTLERIKSSIDVDDEESIDKIDEIQDYLQYLLVVKDPQMEEINEELSIMIDDLQEWGK